MIRQFFLFIGIAILLTVILFIDKQYVFGHLNGTRIQELIDKKNDINFYLRMNQKSQ